LRNSIDGGEVCSFATVGAECAFEDAVALWFSPDVTAHLIYLVVTFHQDTTASV
jgi:hypothetical protein